MTQKHSAVFIEPLRDTHLFQVQLLINRHLSAIVPGWALPEAFIAGNLQRNPSENIIDPWVRERVTLCALQRQCVVAAAHLLRYRNGSYHFAICRRKNGGLPRFHTITEPVFQQASTDSATYQSDDQMRLEAASTPFCRSRAPFAVRSLFIVLVRGCLSGRRERGSAVRAVRALPPDFSLLLE